MPIKFDRFPLRFVFPSGHWLLAALWILGISWIAFLWGLGSTGLIDETEPLFAEAARQMTVTGDWVTPYFNGDPRFDKPPLIYWLMAAGYQLVGVNEWAVRLPSALAAIALTVFVFLTLYRFTTRNRWLIAFIGSGAVALNLETILWARLGVSDMLLSGCLGLALLSFFWGYVQPPDSKAKRFWYLAFYTLLGLAVLAKGPVGIVLPGLILVLFGLYLDNYRALLREMQLGWGIVIMLLVALPWYVRVTLANGDSFIESFIGYHNVERFTRAVNDHAEPWFFYFFVMLIGFAPWSVHLPLAIARLRLRQRQYWQQQPRSAHLPLFALAWFLAIFTFFTLASTKLPSYILPLIPAAAILIGLFWGNEQPDEERDLPLSSGFGWGVSLSHLLHGLLFIALAAALLYSPAWLADDPAMPNFPAVLHQSGVMVWGAVVCTGSAVVSFILLRRDRGTGLWVINLLLMVAIMVGTVIPVAFLLDAERQLPLRLLASTISQANPPGEVVMLGFPKPSLVFYTQRPIRYVVNTEHLAAQLRRPYRFKRNAPPPIWIVGLPHKLDALGLRPDQFTLVQQTKTYGLIRVELPLNRKN